MKTFPEHALEMLWLVSRNLMHEAASPSKAYTLTLNALEICTIKLQTFRVSIPLNQACLDIRNRSSEKRAIETSVGGKITLLLLCRRL